MKTLIVYFSRTGNTRKVAEELKTQLSADVEEITEPTGRAGPIRWLQSGREAMNGVTPKINEPAKDPSGYEMIIVGTPVWAGRMASPVRSYLTKMKGKMSRVAFYCTCGSPPGEVFVGMEDLAGRAVATMIVTAKDMSGAYKEQAKAFAEKVRAS